MDPAQEQLDAYNARDLERFLACYHPDAVVEDSAGALRATYGALFANSPALRAEAPTRSRVGEFVIDGSSSLGIAVTAPR